MNQSNPWWASGLFAIAGGLITALVTVALAVLNRRTERRRLSWDQKMESYPELHLVVNRLVRLRVWPTQAGAPDELLDEIDRIVQRVRLFAPAEVYDAAAELLAAAESLAATVTAIRAESRPAHGDLIDQRDAARHQEAVEALRSAADRFLATARVDIETDRRAKRTEPADSR